MIAGLGALLRSDRFAQRGYLVRLVYGQPPQAFIVPGAVDRRAWVFAYGVAVTDPSLTDAMIEAQRIGKLECR